MASCNREAGKPGQKWSFEQNPEGEEIHVMGGDLIPVLSDLKLHPYMFSALQLLLYFKILWECNILLNRK